MKERAAEEGSPLTEREAARKPPEYALEYAGFWVRLGASIVDGVILYAICGLFLALLFGINGDFLSILYALAAAPVFWAMAWLLQAVYFTGFWVWRGQTPGKMLMGVKVIRTDSAPVDWQHALMRYLGYIVSTVMLFLGFIWIAFDGRKQGVHDKLADTYVVKLPVRQVVFSESYAGGEVGCV